MGCFPTLHYCLSRSPFVDTGQHLMFLITSQALRMVGEVMDNTVFLITSQALGMVGEVMDNTLCF